MKINLPNPEDFHIKLDSLFGVDCFLVYPKFFPKWDNQNRYFRSSIWRKSDLKPLSLSWRKFMNLGESPEFEPINYGKSIDYIQKLDGSTGVISKISGNVCFRTRGTFDARSMENGYEVDEFIKKYPKLFDNELINSELFTILTEWTTPANVICIKETSEPELWLTGVVRHEDYSYISQKELDILAEAWGLRRPKRYSFVNFDKAVSFAESAQGIEGLVLYCNDGQVLKKIKGAQYLALHRFKANANIETVLDLYSELNYPNYGVFQEELIKKFDFECWNMVQGYASQVVDAFKEVKAILAGFHKTVEQVKDLGNRKQQAEVIIGKYGETNRAGFVFKLLDGKDVGKDDLKKLVYQVLKYKK